MTSTPICCNYPFVPLLGHSSGTRSIDWSDARFLERLALASDFGVPKSYHVKRGLWTAPKMPQASQRLVPEVRRGLKARDEGWKASWEELAA